MTVKTTTFSSRRGATAGSTAYDPALWAPLGGPLAALSTTQEALDLIIDSFIVVMPGAINGLNLTWLTGTTFSFSGGSAQHPLAGNPLHHLAAPVTLDISTVGVNGRDSATALAANTLYDVHVINEDALLEVAPVSTPCSGIISFAGAAPVLPAPFDTSRRIGSVLTDAGSAIIEFRQRGANRQRWMIYRAAPLALTGGGAVISTPIALAGLVPGSALQVRTHLEIVSAVVSHGALATMDATLPGAPGDLQVRVDRDPAEGGSNFATGDVMVDTPGGVPTILYSVDSGLATVNVHVLGYEDLL